MKTNSLLKRSIVAVLVLLQLALPAGAADTKISDLPTGTAPQSADKVVIARGGANFQLTWAQLLAGVDLSGYLTIASAASTYLSQSQAATDYLSKAGNLSGLANTTTSRSNLGLGTMAVEVATDYLPKAGNLAGLADAPTSRTNLGLGTIATQAANNVTISGGAITGTTISGSTGSFTSLSASALVSEAGEDTVTAFATGGQTSATALSSTKNFHRVTTSATAGDSVKLPAATVGQRHYVRNDGAAAMQVFGQATETINGVASATGIPQGVGMGVWYVSTTAGAWTTTPVSVITMPAGTSSTPPYTFHGAATVGTFYAGSGFLGLVGSNGVELFHGSTVSGLLTTGQLQVASTNEHTWTSGVVTGTVDTKIGRAGANCLIFGGTLASTAAARTECNKNVTAIANAVATPAFTVSIPNAAHSASLLVRVTCSLGAGGAIGANEATATNTYTIAFTRTPGVAATAAISTATGGAATAVAGAATVTATLAMSAVSGAVGATNTFTTDVTVSRSGGSSTNHTCNMYGQLNNASASGITIT